VPIRVQQKSFEAFHELVAASEVSPTAHNRFIFGFSAMPADV
jgi:hypothetical protein